MRSARTHYANMIKLITKCEHSVKTDSSPPRLGHMLVIVGQDHHYARPRWTEDRRCIHTVVVWGMRLADMDILNVWTSSEIISIWSNQRNLNQMLVKKDIRYCMNGIICFVSSNVIRLVI